MNENLSNPTSHNELIEQAAERLAQIFIAQIEEEERHRKEAADDGWNKNFKFKICN